MAQWHGVFRTYPWLGWLIALLLCFLAAAGFHLSAKREQAAQLEAARLLAAAKPKVPPPPAMIHPPLVAKALQSGTLIVISKKSQTMFVFNNGVLWDRSPISTGKRHHETPSGVYPILQKQKFHRSNLYSGAPMPFMQRITWDGIALHAGRVPGYPASHGCVRLPPAIAEALFKLTNASMTTVVIGDAPLGTEAEAQNYALTAKLPIRAQLAPVAPVAKPPVAKPPAAAPPSPAPPSPAPPSPAPPSPAPPSPDPVPPPPPASPVASSAPPPLPKPATPPPSGETIQLTAALTAADAEAYWNRLQSTHQDLRGFQKRIEEATVNTRHVYRLRISGADAHGYCKKLKRAGIACIEVR